MVVAELLVRASMVPLLLVGMLFIGRCELPNASPVVHLGDSDLPKPKNSSVAAWTRLTNPPPDSAECGLDRDNFNLNELWAFPISGGNPIKLSELQNIDTLPIIQHYFSPIAVYVSQGNWNLVHDKTGWYWVLCREKELLQGNENIIGDCYTLWQDGNWEIHNRETADPSLGDSNWIVYRQISTIEPQANCNLRSKPGKYGKNLGKLKTGYLLLIEFSGDWVKVQEPIETGLIPLPGDRSDLLKVRWNPSRIGWIKWRVPGPVPGRHRILLRGAEEFGIID